MGGLQWPIAGIHPITQGFAGQNVNERAGWLARDNGLPWRAQRSLFLPSLWYRHLHGAIDISCPVGTPILAPETGTVVLEGTYPETGEHYCQLRIYRGTIYQTILFFTHIKAGGLLHPVGAIVPRGKVLALSGNSGMSSGPHLHWEVRRGPASGDPHNSGAWPKFNPNRLKVGGDKAGVPWIEP